MPSDAELFMLFNFPSCCNRDEIWRERERERKRERERERGGGEGEKEREQRLWIWVRLSKGGCIDRGRDNREIPFL